ncbi:DNA primase [Bacillus sp. 03113]|uniref:DNA primase n=1 Tax=Bacillus sp. 03113 TaxID=2578211 RepID=UPI001141FD53|nr:DNA primase [Bacillus sp. 03113]
MSGRIPEDKVNEIRQAVDIVDVISDYVQLKKQGRNYFGLCPFHGENTPSFSVSSDKQIYHCFGCGAGGNAFSFLMEIEGYTFKEAALKLAEKANMDIGLEITSDEMPNAIPQDVGQMISAHDILRKFYHHILVNTKDGQHALEYLLNRGLTLESIQKFQIGYALNSWDFVVKFLTQRKYDPIFMEKAGIIVQSEKNGKYYDRFRDRIMFPIFDRKGNTIAFSGRTLGAGEPKYLNSPETAIFNKSKTLYNYHLARSSIRKRQQAVLFEGFADVIAADRSGVDNGIATMGTSITEEHVAIIRQNVDSVTICYDSDHAGIEAAYRAANMLTNSGCKVRIASLPDGMDPDDYVGTFGEEKFRHEVIDASHTFMNFKLRYFRRGKNLQDEGDRLLYIEEVLKEISRLDKAVEKDHYLRQIAAEFSISLEALNEQQKQMFFHEKRNQQEKGKQNRPTPPLQWKKKTDQLMPAYYTAERRLIAHMLRSDELTYKIGEMLQGKTFITDEHQAIITYLFGFYEEGQMPATSSFINFVQDDKLRRIIAEIDMMPINEDINEQELADYLKQVLNYEKVQKIKEKQAEEKEAEKQKDYVKAAKIAMEIIQIRKSL